MLKDMIIASTEAPVTGEKSDEDYEIQVLRYHTHYEPTTAETDYEYIQNC